MAKTNIQWENYNAQTRYPFRDTSTCVDNNGLELPRDIIVDMHVWYPRTDLVSDFETVKIFVTSVSISANLISLTLGLDDGSGTLIPLGAISVGPTVVPYKNYQISAFVDGFAGWVAFGEAIDNYTTLKSWVFSTAAQTAILPRCAKPYKVAYAGVSSIKKADGFTKLDGDITLLSGNDEALVVEKTTRVIGGNTVNAIVFRLNEQKQTVDIHKSYLGPCDVSPYSGTCLKPPVLNINSVTPDCDGNINLTVVEVVNPEVGSILSLEVQSHNVIFHLKFGMSSLCLESQLITYTNQIISPACYSPCLSDSPGFGTGPFDSVTPTPYP